MVTLWYSGKLSGMEGQVVDGETSGVGVALAQSTQTGICMDWDRIIFKLFFLYIRWETHLILMRPVFNSDILVLISAIWWLRETAFGIETNEPFPVGCGANFWAGKMWTEPWNKETTRIHCIRILWLDFGCKFYYCYRFGNTLTNYRPPLWSFKVVAYSFTTEFVCKSRARCVWMCVI